MDAVADERRWYREIERRLAARFRGVYLTLGFAALMAFGFANTQSMMHDGSLLPVTATVVALGTDSSGEATMTSAFVDAEGNWHRDVQPASYHYARGEPRIGDSIDYLYGIHPATNSFYAVPRADGILKWFFGLPAALFALVGVGPLMIILGQRHRRQMGRHRRTGGHQLEHGHRDHVQRRLRPDPGRHDGHREALPEGQLPRAQNGPPPRQPRADPGPPAPGPRRRR